MKLYIISNRLPVKAVAEKDTFVFSRSEGGLTTGPTSLPEMRKPTAVPSTCPKPKAS